MSNKLFEVLVRPKIKEKKNEVCSISALLRKYKEFTIVDIGECVHDNKDTDICDSALFIKLRATKKEKIKLKE
jgi:hypothetical protein